MRIFMVARALITRPLIRVLLEILLRINMQCVRTSRLELNAFLKDFEGMANGCGGNSKGATDRLSRVPQFVRAFSLDRPPAINGRVATQTKSQQLVKKNILVCLIVITAGSAEALNAKEYYWCAGNWDCASPNGTMWPNGPYGSPGETKADWDVKMQRPGMQSDATVVGGSANTFKIKYTYRFYSYSSATAYMTYYLFGDSCPANKVYNPGGMMCEDESQVLSRKEQGIPDLPQSCAPSVVVADPVNMATGAAIHFQDDLPKFTNSKLKFSRFYNSTDGLWRHSYSANVVAGNGAVSITLRDGRKILFRPNNLGVFSPESTELGSLVMDGQNYIYRSPLNDIYTFNQAGKLISTKSIGNPLEVLTYTTGGVIVENSNGEKLKFTQSEYYQPTSLNRDGLAVLYQYDSSERLIKVTQDYGSKQTVRGYAYSNETGSLNLLTSMTDERGVVKQTWAFDSQGRVISTQNFGDVGKVAFAYNSDGSTSLTNELGKVMVYKFQTIRGVRRIVAMEGSLSENCSASNSKYTYNERGQLLTKTDALGVVTLFGYNDRGLETSRTEASGTALARTITTEWDPVLALPTKVSSPAKTTLYTYDGEGNLLSQRSVSNL